MATGAREEQVMLGTQVHSGIPQAGQGKRRVVLVAWQIGHWNLAW